MQDFDCPFMKTPKGGTLLTMGTFDGVHLGHQSILRRAVERAKKLGLPTFAMTFIRPPRLHFSPQPGPQILTTAEEKKELLCSFGIDRVRAYNFDESFARLSAKEFYKKYIVGRFHAREIVVGYNFAFGRGREGTIQVLRQLGTQSGLSVHIMPPFRLKGRNVSSGRIRRDILLGKVEVANRRLGFAYFATGRVASGRGLGRRLGYPTANLIIPREKILPLGVFAVRVHLPDGKTRGGMCNVGFHPTVGRSADLSVEVNLFNYKAKLVGKNLRIYFVKRIRAEKKFASLEELSKQLRKDESAAKRILRTVSGVD